MSIAQMRKAIESHYGPSWIDRVAKMKDKQVIAIYYRMLRDGQLK